MPTMDVDMQSSPFRTTRSSSAGVKRARSPSSPGTSGTSGDRPVKRLFSGANNSVSHPICAGPGSVSVSVPVHLQTRQVSEDWVAQTRGLRIDRDGCTPQPSPQLQAQPSSMGGGMSVFRSDESESMSMDHDVHMSSFSVQQQQQSYASNASHAPTPMSMMPQSSLIIPSGTSMPSFSHSAQQNISYASPHPHSQRTTPSPFPETRLDETHAHPPHQGQQVHPQAPPTESQSSSTRRRPQQKFTMGPRADCEKCRLGVKGHYAHFD
ncbi:hypothetical protein K474DRAFT_1670166 [Panus rudis PR-1116 ss-1]|nr:hypothetical protein K474DRAFT_1670166 [Panus rudis PR-1116 ss-1]